MPKLLSFRIQCVFVLMFGMLLICAGPSSAHEDPLLFASRQRTLGTVLTTGIDKSVMSRFAKYAKTKGVQLTLSPSSQSGASTTIIDYLSPEGAKRLLSDSMEAFAGTETFTFRGLTIFRGDVENPHRIHEHVNSLLDRFPMFTTILPLSGGIPYLERGLTAFREEYGTIASMLILTAYLNNDTNASKLPKDYRLTVVDDVRKGILNSERSAYISAQALQAGSSNLFSESLTFSTRDGIAHSPLDVSVTRIDGQNGMGGFGGSFRWGLSDSHSPEYFMVKHIKDSLRGIGTENDRQKDAVRLVVLQAACSGFLLAHVDSARNPHVAATLHYQHFDGLGYFYSAGAEFSIPWHAPEASVGQKRAPTGLYALLSLQSVSLHSFPQTPTPAKTVSWGRAGVGLCWQNRIPYSKRDLVTSKGVPDPARWTVQMSGIVMTENRSAGDTTFTYELRWRKISDRDFNPPVWSFSVGTGLKTGQFGMAGITFPL